MVAMHALFFAGAVAFPDKRCGRSSMQRLAASPCIGCRICVLGVEVDAGQTWAVRSG
jgi:hypothetical protein